LLARLGKHGEANPELKALLAELTKGNAPEKQPGMTH
jgi:hypothetical protein